MIDFKNYHSTGLFPPTPKRFFLILFFLVFCSPVILFGEQTRIKKIAAKQEEKSRNLATYKASGAEELIIKSEQWGFFAVPRGLYPFIGSAFSGGGIAVGGGYRFVYGDTSAFDVHAGISIKSYKIISATFQTPRSPD